MVLWPSFSAADLRSESRTGAGYCPAPAPATPAPDELTREDRLVAYDFPLHETNDSLGDIGGTIRNALHAPAHGEVAQQVFRMLGIVANRRVGLHVHFVV